MIESARTRPIDADPTERISRSRREITRTVKIVMKRARSLPVAAALVMVAAAFLGGVLLGDQRGTHAVAPVVVPAAALSAAAPGSPEAAPALAPMGASTGFDIRVTPRARVVLDGRPIGTAPLRVRNLTAGEHVIELAADGYFARRLSVTLEAGEPQTLEVALDRLEPEPEPEPEPRAAAPAAAPPERPEPRDSKQPRGKGLLKIGSKPPCKVVINGREVGITPEMIELGAGRHSVSLINQTYAIRERIRVTIKPGETVKVLRDYSDALESSAP